MARNGASAPTIVTGHIARPSGHRRVDPGWVNCEPEQQSVSDAALTEAMRLADGANRYMTQKLLREDQEAPDDPSRGR
jgi:hypothetical protein